MSRRRSLKAAFFALLALLANACGGVAKAPGEPGSSNAGATSTGSSSAGTNGNAVANGGQTASAGSSPIGGATAGTTSIATPDSGGHGLDVDAGSPKPPAMHLAIACESPTPRAHGGGYLACGDGSLRRTTAAACTEALPRAAPDTPIVYSECTSDTDCTASAHGYCAYGACKYGCVTDAECPSDQACFCGDFVGQCIPARCRTDADCPTGFPCTGFQAPGFSAPDALACQSPEDECLTDAQCGSLNPRVSCKVQVDHRVCYLDPIS